MAQALKSTASYLLSDEFRKNVSVCYSQINNAPDVAITKLESMLTEIKEEKESVSQKLKDILMSTIPETPDPVVVSSLVTLASVLMKLKEKLYETIHSERLGEFVHSVNHKFREAVKAAIEVFKQELVKIVAMIEELMISIRDMFKKDQSGRSTPGEERGPVPSNPVPSNPEPGNPEPGNPEPAP